MTAFRAVLRKGLFDARWQMLGWGIGLFLMAFVNMLSYPSVADNQGLADYWEELPDSVKDLFGGVDSILTLEGFIESQLISYLPILLGIPAIMQGAAAVAGEEENGTIDLLLAQPLGRRTMLLGKGAATLASLFVITAATALGLVLGSLAAGIDGNYLRIFLVSFDALPAAFTIVAVAYLGSAWTSRGRTVLIATLFLVASFFLAGLSSLWDVLEHVQLASVFYWAAESSPLGAGFDWLAVGVQLLGAAVFAVIAVWLVERKDLGT